MKLEIKKIGNSTGLILPKELLARLGLQQGDQVVVTEAPDGFKVSRDNAEFERAMSIVDDIMVEYRETLQALAK
jgi:putative addiction module antidote